MRAIIVPLIAGVVLGGLLATWLQANGIAPYWALLLPLAGVLMEMRRHPNAELRAPYWFLLGGLSLGATLVLVLTSGR